MILLRETPGDRAREAVEGLSNDEDRLVLTGRELHWLPSGGVSDSELDAKALAGLLGPSTTRTHNTIQRIAARFLAWRHPVRAPPA